MLSTDKACCISEAHGIQESQGLSTFCKMAIGHQKFLLLG